MQIIFALRQAEIRVIILLVCRKMGIGEAEPFPNLGQRKLAGIHFIINELIYSILH